MAILQPFWPFYSHFCPFLAIFYQPYAHLSQNCVGNDESYFCAKSLDDLMAYNGLGKIMWPLVQKIQNTSEKITLKVGIDLDGTVVRIDGTIHPRAILNAMSKKGISLDFKSNDRFDDVSIILSTLFSWHLLVLNFPLFINNFLPND